MIEWADAVPQLSSFTLARICLTNSRGGCLGAHSELDTISWLQPMLDICNMAHKNANAVDSRTTLLSFPNWSRKKHNPMTGNTAAPSSTSPVSSVSVGHNLVLPAEVARRLGYAAPQGDPSPRLPSPPRASSYRDVTLSPTVSPTRQSPSTTSETDESWWDLGSSQLVTRHPTTAISSPERRLTHNPHSDALALLEQYKLEVHAEHQLALSLLRTEMRAEFGRLLSEQKEEIDRKQAEDNKVLTEGMAEVKRDLSGLSAGFSNLSGELSVAMSEYRQESKAGLDMLTAELSRAMSGQQREIKTALDEQSRAIDVQRRESQAQNEAILSAIRANASATASSAAPVSLPAPDPPLAPVVGGEKETLYRLAPPDQINRSLKTTDTSKRLADRGAFQPRQRVDTKSTPIPTPHPAPPHYPEVQVQGGGNVTAQPGMQAALFFDRGDGGPGARIEHPGSSASGEG